jgi:hypothetical protein
MARAATSRIYDPEDPNSTVAFEARCDIIYTVLSHEPGIWSRAIETVAPIRRVLPHWLGVLGNDEWVFDILASYIDSLAFELDQRDYHFKHNEDAIRFNKQMKSQGREYRIKLYPPEKLERINAFIEVYIELAVQVGSFGSPLLEPEHVLILADLYRQTCLGKMGARCYSLLLRFLSFCFDYRIDPRDYAYIYQMVERKPLESSEKTVPLPYRFEVVEWNDFIRRISVVPGVGSLTVDQLPEWFFDEGKGEYVTHRGPLDVGNLEAATTRVLEAMKESWQDYNKRCLEVAGRRGLKVYSGSRKKPSGVDYDYCLYLYMVKDWGTDRIHETLFPDSDPAKALELPNLERGMRRRAKLAHLEFLPFGKKREIERELAELGIET